MKWKIARRGDLLKLIHRLSAKSEVRGADLADALAIKHPTVCIYLKRLLENGDITRDAHHCVSRTEQGRAVAEEVLRKHGMLMDLLLEPGVPREAAAKDTCVIQRNLRPETYIALKQLLTERQKRI